MKILIGICGSFGHATPFFGICEKLQELGHEIIFAVNSENLELFDKYNFNVKSYMPIFKDDLTYSNYDEFINYIVQRVQNDSFDYFDEFNKLMDGVDLVLRETNCPLAYIAAEYNNVPCVDFILSPMFFTTGLVPVGGGIGITRYNELRTKLGMSRRDSTPFFIWNQNNLKIASYPEFYVESNRKIVSEFFSHPHLRFTNFPLLSSTDYELSSEVEAFLSSGEPPVVFAMSTGSNYVTSPSNFWEIAYQLGKNIKRSILLTSQGDFPSHENVLFLPGLVSHDKLFPRCSLVVNGGGFGTMGRIMYHNIPQVSVPQMSENVICAELMSDMLTVVYPKDFSYDTFAPLMIDSKFNKELGKKRSDIIKSIDSVEMIVDILKEYKYIDEQYS